MTLNKLERTLSIIKPDATRRNLVGSVVRMLEEADLSVIAQKRLHLSERQARDFYAVHAERPFYASLVDFMTSGAVVVQVLEGEDAIARNREVMGATNPSEAKADTIRARHGISLEQNSVHGSDSASTAASEIAFFFSEVEIFPNPIQ